MQAKNITTSVKQDGTWLLIKASNGTEAMINVENTADKMGGPMVQKTIKQWCKDQQIERLLNVS